MNLLRDTHYMKLDSDLQSLSVQAMLKKSSTEPSPRCACNNADFRLARGGQPTQSGLLEYHNTFVFINFDSETSTHQAVRDTAFDLDLDLAAS
jgi:hypothetical protein